MGHGKSEISEARAVRDKEILHLRLVERWTLDRIGRRFGLTKQRVQQIIRQKT